MQPIDPAAIELPVTQPIDITVLVDSVKPDVGDDEA